jgi:hypothetical protein
VRRHVLLGVGLDHTGDAEAVGAHGPAHDGGIPDLQAPEMGEAHDERPVDAGHVGSMTEPEADALAPGGIDGRPDPVEGVAPGHGPPAILAPAAVPHEGTGEPPTVVRNLDGGAAADAEEAPAVRIVGVAAQAEDAAFVRDLDEHAAEGGMAVHGAHGPDGAARHGEMIPSALPPARGFC